MCTRYGRTGERGIVTFEKVKKRRVRTVTHCTCSDTYPGGEQRVVQVDIAAEQ